MTAKSVTPGLENDSTKNRFGADLPMIYFVLLSNRSCSSCPSRFCLLALSRTFALNHDYYWNALPG